MSDEKTTQEEQKQSTELATYSERFMGYVERQFKAELGEVLKWDDVQKSLAQHLYLKIDASLRDLEYKRLDKGTQGLPMTWENINLSKLALDSVHRVSLGLDALIANHIHVIPYKNKRTGKYDLDLRVGYVGKLYSRKILAVDDLIDVHCQLVHQSDKFSPHIKDAQNPVDSYTFKVEHPFDRGNVIGGFGYISYNDPRKNKLIIVTERDFERARKSAQTQDFWGDDKHGEEMKLKTVIHRTADKILLDPRKVNTTSLAKIDAENDERARQVADDAIELEVIENGNGQVLDVTGIATEGEQPKPEPAEQPPDEEKKPKEKLPF